MTTENTAGPPVEVDRLVTRPFFLILLFAFMFFVGIGMTLPLLPVFVKDSLGGSDIAIGVVVAIQAVSAILVRPWINPRLARFGAVRVIMWSAVLGALSMALMAYAPNVLTLVILRLVLGGAQAAMFIAMLSTIMSWVSEWRRAEAASVFSVAPYIGLAIGPVIGQMTYKAFGFTTAFVLSGV
ncbi:MAG: MFS transporter, partial [Actinobacteria bacterium]|nr:MFS transporter [Actinomycetota bacterium]